MHRVCPSICVESVSGRSKQPVRASFTGLDLPIVTRLLGGCCPSIRISYGCAYETEMWGTTNAQTYLMTAMFTGAVVLALNTSILAFELVSGHDGHLSRCFDQSSQDIKG